MSRLYFRTLSKAMAYYTGQNYVFAFNFPDPSIDPSEWAIVAVHRFEGFTDPSDNMILFVLENESDSNKGIILDAYGADRSEPINQFLQQVSRRFPD